VTSSSAATSEDTSSSGAAASSSESPVDTSAAEASTTGATATGSGENTGTGDFTCVANTDNGDHSHVLTIPPEDVMANLAEATYTLEDGGTGHTHTVTLTAYDFLYLNAGTGRTVESTTDAGHSHPCEISCGAMNAGPMCTATTDNGDHSHPLTIPGSDVTANLAEATYTLEDGGTGHTHTVTLTAYDFLYLAAGTTWTVDSSVNAEHSHPCTIMCTT
jgi:hypothetical protein